MAISLPRPTRFARRGTLRGKICRWPSVRRSAPPLSAAVRNLRCIRWGGPTRLGNLRLDTSGDVTRAIKLATEIGPQTPENRLLLGARAECQSLAAYRARPCRGARGRLRPSSLAYRQVKPLFLRSPLGQLSPMAKSNSIASGRRRRAGFLANPMHGSTPRLHKRPFSATAAPSP